MGDVSNEPSMEDILSSIKRIIAEEGDAAAANRPRRPARAAAPTYAPVDDDEILELNQPAPDEPAQPEPRRAPPPPIQPEALRVDLRDVAPEPAPQPTSRPAAPEPILSPTTAEATRGPLEALSRMVVKPEAAPAPAIPAGETSLEGMVREMIRPMLRDWLDANLPHMVEEMVQREISRIAAGRD
jgi:cell pole-organizing protein PopZ